MIQRIAVMGAGSLGTILGAYLSKAGRDVVLIDTYQAHVDALNQNGAHITGAVEMTVPVKAITPEQMEGQYDLFFYLAKQTYNDVAIPQMMAHMGEGSVICTGQNGLPERAVSKAVGVHRTLGSPVGWGATFMGPGCSALTSTSQAFYLGTLDGQITEKLLEVKSILEDMCPVHVSENLMGYRWTKLLVNCTFSGLSASFGCTFGDVLDDPRATLWRETWIRSSSGGMRIPSPDPWQRSGRAGSPTGNWWPAWPRTSPMDASARSTPSTAWPASPGSTPMCPPRSMIWWSMW